MPDTNLSRSIRGFPRLGNPAVHSGLFWLIGNAFITGPFFETWSVQRQPIRIGKTDPLGLIGVQVAIVFRLNLKRQTLTQPVEFRIEAIDK